MEDVGRVGVEGDGGGTDAQFLGAGDDGGDDRAMATVDAVEVADGNDGGSGKRFEFGERAGYEQGFKSRGLGFRVPGLCRRLALGHHGQVAY